MRRSCTGSVLLPAASAALVGILAIFYNFGASDDTMEFEQSILSFLGNDCLEADTNGFAPCPTRGNTKLVSEVVDEVESQGNDEEEMDKAGAESELISEVVNRVDDQDNGLDDLDFTLDNVTDSLLEESSNQTHTGHEKEPFIETGIAGSSQNQTSGNQTLHAERQQDHGTDTNATHSSVNKASNDQTPSGNDQNETEKALAATLPNPPPSQQILTGRKQRPCAPWIPQDRRKVLLLDGATYELFHDAAMHHGGENYVFAALDWALRQNGFQVDRAEWIREKDGYFYGNRDGPNVTEDLAKTYHRAFTNGLESRSVFSTSEDCFCRLRPLHFWADYKLSSEETTEGFVFAPEQVWVPYEDSYDTFIGYFVHALLDEFSNGKKPRINDDPRPKAGLVLGKAAELFEGRKDVLQALVDAGFTLHVTVSCDDTERKLQDEERQISNKTRKHLRRLANATKHTGGDNTRHNAKTSYSSFQPSDEWENIIFGNNPWTTRSSDELTTNATHLRNSRRKTMSCSSLMPSEGIVYHGAMTPEDYADLMYNVTFLLGLGDPIVSPSPLVGLAHGVAWLNAAKDDSSNQHANLKSLGLPYVYNFDLRDPRTAVQAANLAQKYPFQPFVPWAFRPKSMVDRVCAMMEDESAHASCKCLQQERRNKRNQSQRKLNGSSTAEETHASMDCRSSWYVRM